MSNQRLLHKLSIERNRLKHDQMKLERLSARDKLGTFLASLVSSLTMAV
jgi:hypothetical protein